MRDIAPEFIPTPLKLGAVIEAVTGVTLGEFFKERIFEPLGMANTAFDVAGEDVHRLAPCFYFTGRSNWIGISNLSISYRAVKLDTLSIGL